MSQDMSATIEKSERDIAAGAEATGAGAVAGTAVMEPEVQRLLPSSPKINPEEMNPEFAPGTFSADRYADRLMDDIFKGVEHLLETGMEPPSEKPEPQYLSIQSIQMPEVSLPLSLIPEGMLAQPEPDAEAEADTKAEATLEAEPVRRDRTFLLLCALALATFAGATAAVATQWQSYRALYLQVTGQVVPETVAAVTPELQSPNAQFANYVQRSLEVLKDQTAIAQAGDRVVLTPPAVLQVPPSPVPTVASAPVLPPVPGGSDLLPGGAAASATASQTEPRTIVERIYIPVYQTPNGYMPVNPNIQLSPEVTAAGVLPLSQPPAPRTAQGNASGNPSVAAPEPEAIAAIDAASQSNAASAAAPDSPTDASPPAAPIVSSYTLVGLLELGSGSAALVEVNGVTRRLSLGERIGGWSLAEVKDGEAVFRRSGEVRSVFVGQAF